MKGKFLVFLLVTALVLTFCPLVAFASQATNISVVVNNNPANEQLGDGGWVNWEQGIIKAVGYGAPSTRAKSQAQARLLARIAAKADAQRNLLEAIQGIRVDSETTVENLEVTSDIIKTSLSGFLKGAQIVSEKQLSDGTYEIVMAVNLYGANSLNKVIYEAKPPVQQPLPIICPDYQVPANLSSYTGLVIDARRLGLDRCFSPKIYDQTGREIFGTMYVDPDFLQENGLVSYAASPQMLQQVDCGQSRAGTNPLVVRAIGVKDHNYNIVISKADGDRILAANAQNGFLAKCAVVIKK